jgi:hypothetical protein
MSEFWGFEGAHLLAIAMIVVLAGICLYMGRTWGEKL